MDLNRTTVLKSSARNRRTTFTLERAAAAGLCNQTFVTASDTTDNGGPSINITQQHYLPLAQSDLPRVQQQQHLTEQNSDDEPSDIENLTVEIMRIISTGKSAGQPKKLLADLTNTRNKFSGAFVASPRHDLQTSVASEVDLFENSAVEVLSKRRQEMELQEVEEERKAIREKIDRITREETITEQNTKKHIENLDNEYQRANQKLKEYPTLLKNRHNKIENIKQSNLRTQDMTGLMLVKNNLIKRLHQVFLNINDEFQCTDESLCRTFNGNHEKCFGASRMNTDT